VHYPTLVLVVTGQPVTSPSSQKKRTGDERKQRDIVTINPCATPNIGSGGSDWATCDQPLFPERGR